MKYLQQIDQIAAAEYEFRMPSDEYTPPSHNPADAIKSLRDMSSRLDAACELLVRLGPAAVHGAGVGVDGRISVNAAARAATDLPLTLVALERLRLAREVALRVVRAC